MTRDMELTVLKLEDDATDVPVETADLDAVHQSIPSSMASIDAWREWGRVVLPHRLQAFSSAPSLGAASPAALKDPFALLQAVVGCTAGLACCSRGGAACGLAADAITSCMATGQHAAACSIIVDLFADLLALIKPTLRLKLGRSGRRLISRAVEVALVSDVGSTPEQCSRHILTLCRDLQEAHAKACPQAAMDAIAEWRRALHAF